MSLNSFGHLFRFTTWGESHGPALGAVVDGCPPGLALSEADLQPFLDARRPGQSKFTTQRQEPDAVKILSGVFEGRTTGTPISLMIENVDQRSKDYSEVAVSFRPHSTLMAVGLGMVLGGALGNLTDRVVRGPGLSGKVIDFVDFHIWPIFNAADSAIVIGAGLILLASARSGDREPAEAEVGGGGPAAA